MHSSAKGILFVVPGHGAKFNLIGFGVNLINYHG